MVVYLERKGKIRRRHSGAMRSIESGISLNNLEIPGPSLRDVPE